METLLQANIFFFITAVATVVLSILVGIAVVYLIRILRNVRDISDTAEREVELLAKDVDDLRGDLRNRGRRLSGLFSFVKKRKEKRHTK
jgi:uncharacterized protein YoxC